jgi:hypothetical protein
MVGGIYLIKDEDVLVEMTEQQYDSEDILQGLLDKYPLLLAGDQIDSEVPRQWLPIAREKGVPDSQDGPQRWFLDHLFLDQDGIPDRCSIMPLMALSIGKLNRSVRSLLSAATT